MREYMQALLLESGTLSMEDILLRILASAAFGAAIYLSYWYTHTGTTYSKKFNVSLVTLSQIQKLSHKQINYMFSLK